MDADQRDLLVFFAIMSLMASSLIIFFVYSYFSNLESQQERKRRRNSLKEQLHEEFWLRTFDLREIVSQLDLAEIYHNNWEKRLIKARYRCSVCRSWTTSAEIIRFYDAWWVQNGPEDHSGEAEVPKYLTDPKFRLYCKTCYEWITDLISKDTD